MKDEVTILNINCGGTVAKADLLDNLLCDYSTSINSNYLGWGETEVNAYETLKVISDTQHEEIKNSLEKIYSFFEDKLGRYWKLTVTSVSKKTNIHYENVYYIYPRHIDSINNKLWCLYINDIDSASLAGISNKFFDIDTEFLAKDNCTIKLEEISKDNFISIAKEEIDKKINKYETRLLNLSNK